MLSGVPGGEEFIRRTPAACIGPITADTARGRGFKVEVEAETYTTLALARAIAAFFQAAS